MVRSHPWQYDVIEGVFLSSRVTFGFSKENCIFLLCIYDFLFMLHNIIIYIYYYVLRLKYLIIQLQENYLDSYIYIFYLNFNRLLCKHKKWSP